jgi:hypothetical protein
MPPVKITRTSGANGAKAGGGGGGVVPGDITPQEAAAIRSSVAGKEQAPSQQQQAIFANWRQAADQLGNPFEVEHIPLSRLRAMRRDPMLSFGLNFIKTPHVRAKWNINAKDKNGPNPQVAAHLDYDLRRIYATYVFQWCNSLDLGFQPLAKRFELGIPAGTYIQTDQNTGTQTEQPIWSQGGIQPIRWKPFVTLQPEACEPIWAGDGSFNGIDFDPSQQAYTPPTTSGITTAYKIDLYHSLWVTHEREQNFGSIYGYPRLGYAYRYWWSYWFRWAIADRAFERKADPSVLVYHPDGEFVDETTGATTSYSDYALTMGERMRSGGVIALPSEVYEDATGKGTIRQWEIDFTQNATNFDPFDKSFEYLDIAKIRALAVPEQAFFEGRGGTSSRNVAAEMQSSFTESQAVLSAQIVESINRWLIPQWLAVNYPDFLQNAGTANFVMQGFADVDVAFTQQVIQLIGQQPEGVVELLKLVDLHEVLLEAGVPIADFAEQQRRQAEITAAAQAAQPPAVTPAPGGVGVVPSSTGFSYIAGPPEPIVIFSTSGTKFIESLPDTPHYSDKAIKGFARQLWSLYHDLYADEYASALAALEKANLSDETEVETVELAARDWMAKATKLIADWQMSKRWVPTLQRTKEIFQSMFSRAAKVELSRSKLSGQLDDTEVEAWIDSHIAEIATEVATTTRTELRDFVAATLAENPKIELTELTQRAREHFVDFPDWKSDRLVRTEVRDVYNAATALAAQAAGANTLQAIDAQHGPTDRDCMERNGQLFSPDEALREREHPNGTLAWRILPVTNLSIERRADLDEGVLGRYDAETETIMLAENVSEADEREYVAAVAEALCR